MTQAAAAWRVTYTPGNWLVLSGPTTLVVMLPAPARASDLVGELWRDILAAGSVDALLRLAAEVGLDAMPDFGAFFWDEAGLHGLTRGSVRVLDADTGEVALEGSGAVTWNEAPLGAERRLRIDLEPVDRDEMLQLPLVVGAACVSTIHLSTAPDALVSFPTREQGDLVTPPARAAAPEAEEPDADAVADLAAAITSPPTEDAPRDQAEEPAEEEPIPPAEPAPESATPDALTPEMSAAEMPAPGAGLLGVPGGPLPGVPTPGGPLPGVPGPLAAAVPVPPPAPPVGQRGAPVVVAPTLGEVDEDDGGTIFSTGLAATHKPAANERVEPQVLAVPCINGHANAPGSRSCRICQGPVDSSNPRLIRRPLLAGVHTNQGDFVDIVSGVVVGRAPDPSRGPDGASLLRVPSPSSDISRNHLLITTKEWNVHVADLHSTNGTTVLPVGEPPFTLRDGASVQVELGTVLDLGDGVSIRIEPPRG